MFNWIERIFHWGVVNIGGTIVGWVRDFIHGVYGYLHSLFGEVSDGWREFWADLNGLWRSAYRFVFNVYEALWHIFRKLIPDIIRWARKHLDFIYKWVFSIWRWIARHVAWLIKKIEHAVATLIHWAIVHIWTPLRRDFLNAWHWISHEGRLVLFYIEHPSKLIDLVWDFLIAKLEREAWRIGKTLGNFFLGLVLHNAKRFALLIEDIIVSLI